MQWHQTVLVSSHFIIFITAIQLQEKKRKKPVLVNNVFDGAVKINFIKLQSLRVCLSDSPCDKMENTQNAKYTVLKSICVIELRAELATSFMSHNFLL